MSGQKPSPGRVVMVVLERGIVRPADVLQAFPENRINALVKLDATNDLKAPLIALEDRRAAVVPANLQNFTRPAVLLQIDSIPEDQEGKAPGTWHWPPRV